MLRLRQAVIVEGKYDKAKLSSLIDANIITTDGFDIFRDREKLAMLRRLAKKTGIIVLTDSDQAGFRIRRHIAGAVPPEQVTHVFIPDLAGKERRKTRPGAEGLLGVEGIPDTILLEAFRKAGLCGDVKQETVQPLPQTDPLTVSDFVEWGLSGGENSHDLRLAVLKVLGLPRRLSTKAILQTVNTLYGRDEFLALLKSLQQTEKSNA